MSTSDVSLFVNFYNVSTSATGCDNTNATAIGSITPLTNFLNGLPSGLQFRVADAAPSKSSGTSTTQDAHGISAAIWNACFVYTAGTTGKLYIEETSVGSSSWNIGDELTIDFGGLNTNATRNIKLTSASGGNAKYTNIARTTAEDFPPPAAFESTVQDLGDGRACVILSPSDININSQLQFIRAYAAPRINSFNDGTVKIGEASTFAVKYFVPAAGNIGGAPLTSVTSTTGIAPDFIDGEPCPAYGLNTVHLQNADNTKSADYSIYVLPPIGYAKTDIRNIANASDGYLKKYIPELAEDAQVTFKLPAYFDPPISLNTVDVDGAIRTDFIGTQTIKVRDKLTGIVTFYDLVTQSTGGGGDGGVSIVSCLKANYFSAEKFKGKYF
jgi:hypothetical protein